ncbi:MAG: sigma-70 family RNA polymerase sigma factor [Polyangiaceae bacterium]
MSAAYNCPATDREALLLEGLRRGDSSAQTLVFRAYEHDAKRVLSRILRERSDVLDALQDTFVKVFRNAGQLEDPLALRSWVLRVAQSVGLDEFRRRQRLRLADIRDVRRTRAESSVLPPVELRSALREACCVLDVLPEPEREVFVLRYIDGLELTQIAEASGVSLATVKRRLSRASTRFTALARRKPALTDWIGRGRLERDAAAQ